ncbi:hypothetical protein Cni_G27999 [Canna indica]|uniref:Uncharacterized protein n=1 Tax=Canna indica TaxID=4628 RepID=A0AAQ3QRZ2_9LILI|nr:hypothetical protein Cni_G27999 [Canna indica]
MDRSTGQDCGLSKKYSKNLYKKLHLMSGLPDDLMNVTQVKVEEHPNSTIRMSTTSLETLQKHLPFLMKSAPVIKSTRQQNYVLVMPVSVIQQELYCYHSIMIITRTISSKQSYYHYQLT